ncbi:MAG TPA: hypothetical protein PKV66_00020 [Candidatus Pelethenecus sp.]|nr:hypothetical protein [Candidatus Pelethenecus sp.]
MNNNNEGLLILETGRDRIVGSIMEIIEASGLQERQETSIKNLIKKIIYEELEYPGAVRVPSDLYEATVTEAMKRIQYEEEPENK